MSNRQVEFTEEEKGTIIDGLEMWLRILEDGIADPKVDQRKRRGLIGNRNKEADKINSIYRKITGKDINYVDYSCRES